MDEDIDSFISDYLQEGLSYANIVTVLRERHGIQISIRHLHRVLRSLSLRRREYSDARSVVEFVVNSIEHSGRQNHATKMFGKWIERTDTSCGHHPPYMRPYRYVIITD